MKQKTREKLERDFTFYRDFPRDGIFMYDMEECIFDETAKDAVMVFFGIDTYGHKAPFRTTQSELLEQVLQGKRLVNFAVKQWAEGISKALFTKYEAREWADELQAPDWFYEAIVQQADKLFKEVMRESIAKLRINNASITPAK
jgi:hypothetical protein